MLAVAALGDSGVRHPLYEAANMLKRYRGFFSLKTWGMKIAKKHGHKKACVAVARKLTVIMHAMWRDGSEFRFKLQGGGRRREGLSDEAHCWGVTGRDQRDECAARTD